MEVRKAFANTLQSLMEKNPKIVMLDADLAKAGGTFSLRKVFPNRAIDCGIAECNMVSIAAGLSAYGYIPFVSTFAPFVARRAFDQIAVSVAYGGQNVKIIGTDPGISAQLNGGTHMSFEDVAAMRAIQNMVVFEPVDAIQMEQAVEQIVNYNGPVYVRMYRKDTPDVFTAPDYKFDLFKADKIKDGKDISIFVSGLSTVDVIAAGEELAKEGIDAEIINIHTVKPIDREAVIASAKKTGRVLTVENHNKFGGLYSAVSEVLSEELPTPMQYVAIEDKIGVVGKLGELKEYYGLTVKDIVAKAKKLFK